MALDPVAAALRDASDTREFLTGSGVLAQLDPLFAKAFGDVAAVVVADENTYAAAGAEVHERLRAAGREVAAPIIFPGRPTLAADFDNALALEERLRPVGAIPVAVGSGTINDLTKLASHRVGRPYMIVGTAASMDGYTSYGAAIAKDGFKQTMECPAPRAVLADLDVLMRAPEGMTASGYGDLLGKITAGADWILADAVGSELIDMRAWPLVQDSLREWTAHPAELRAGDAKAMTDLFEGLTLVGLAMQISRSSRPASGSEHRFSHLWEMQAAEHGHPPVPHGFKVGVGSIASAALYELLLQRDLTHLDVDALVAAWPSRDELAQQVRDAHDIGWLGESAVKESLVKYITPEQLRERLLLIQRLWPTLKPRLEQQLMTAEELAGLLKAVGAPTTPAEVGVTRQQLKESYLLSRTIRSRYSVLDLATEAGLLDTLVDELFAPGGYWEYV
ncbi:MAG: sn-glycerol-1-phosphate dehydrogenase [Anaerolineae bacterium]